MSNIKLQVFEINAFFLLLIGNLYINYYHNMKDVLTTVP